MKRGNPVKKLVLVTVSFALFFGLSSLPARALEPKDVPTITVHELKKKLDKAEKVIVLDMRVGGDYAKSKFRIKGDVRMPLEAVGMRAKELPMGYEIVTYCT
jgi:hypothetical protein